MFSRSSEADAASRCRSSSRAVHWRKCATTRRGRSRSSLAAVALDLRGRPFVGLDRPGELLLDARAEHLDRDLAALGGDRAMDLGDRGGADRHLVELARRGSRAARRTSVSIVCLIAANGAGGRSSCSCDRFSAASLADEVGTGRQRLAELDRRRADRDERRRHNRASAGCARRSGRCAPAGARAAASADRARCRASAPCRASVRPHFSRRHRWVTLKWSNLPARVDGDEAAEHRLGRGADEAGLGDHRA